MKEKTWEKIGIFFGYLAIAFVIYVIIFASISMWICARKGGI